MSNLDKAFIGTGKQVKNLDIVRVSLRMSDLLNYVETYKGEEYINFELAKRKSPDKYGRSHAAYVRFKSEETTEAPE